MSSGSVAVYLSFFFDMNLVFSTVVLHVLNPPSPYRCAVNSAVLWKGEVVAAVRGQDEKTVLRFTFVFKEWHSSVPFSVGHDDVEDGRRE